LITAAEIPEYKNAWSLGAKTVKTLFLSETAFIRPALVTAAFRIEKLVLVFNMSPIVLPDGTVIVLGTASGTFLLQAVKTIATIAITGKVVLKNENVLFM